MSFLIDDAVKQNAAEKAQERSLLRQKREALVAIRRMYSDDSKIDTVKTYLALGGNLRLTAGATGISYYTLQNWKATAWWKKVVEELRKEDRLILSMKTKDILNNAILELADRIKNGDVVVNTKTGETSRRPLNGRDLHRVVADMIDKTDKLEKSIEENVAPESDSNRMIKLAEHFAALSIKAAEKQLKMSTNEVVDVESREV